MVKFEFWLTDEDFARLYAIKRAAGCADMSGNDYAERLLVREIHRLHPEQVHDDEL